MADRQKVIITLFPAVTMAAEEAVPLFDIHVREAQADPVFKDHRKLSKSAIVIDQGTAETRVGYAKEATPRLQFPSIVSKSRNKRVSELYPL